MADDLVERLQKREHHFRRAVEGEYDANLLMKARFALEDAAARIEALEAALAEARRTALTECLRIAKAAQYSKSPATDTMRGIQKLIEDSPTPPPVV